MEYFFVFVAHTTAGLTVNENDDHNVAKDILNNLEELIPKNKTYKHCCDRNNAPAHIKSTLVGNSGMFFLYKRK